MSQQPIAVVGDGNIAGNLNNVENTYITHVSRSEQEKGKSLTLESCVAFEALLNAKERYPAPRCHVDTRIAAQGVVTNWICRKGKWADKGIMWISGAPGVGKSAIVQTVCEVLGGDDGSKSWLTTFGLSDRHVDGCHFFGRGLGNREQASFFPATIAYQLSRSRSTFRVSINQTIANDPSILAEAFPSQFQQLVIKPVKALWWFQHPATIVIDALDECNDADDQVQLLNLIFKTVTSTRTRFLIASRPEHQIHAFFQREDVSQHTYHIRLDEESFNTSRDIEVFLRAEFARIRREKPHLCLPLPNGEDWPGNVVVIRIRDDSDSQFIFPTLAIGFIDTPSYTPDQQLQILLAAPPPRAFSKLDALYERVLSRCPPDLHEGSDELIAYQKLVLDILAVVVAWSEPIHATTIAGVLKMRVDVVQNIILGPMRSLFKIDTSKPNSPITLCHKSLRDYLLDIERSHKFFISSIDGDSLFIGILSRSPPPNRSYTQDELRSVLAVTMNWPGELTVPRIAEVLDVSAHLVQNVVLGPARALFYEGTEGKIELTSSSLKVFLHDVTRSGEFFVPTEDPEPIFTRILSRPPPSDRLHSYCCDDLLDVLTAVMTEDGPTTESEIKASLLGVDASIVRRVVFGPARALFDTSEGIQFSTSLLTPFLQDATRSGEFYIRGEYDSDAIFIRILSRPPPSDRLHSYCRDDLLDVLATVMIQDGPTTKSEIKASLLGVDASIVRRVVRGPARALFDTSEGKIQFSTSLLRPFLQDITRSGEFYIRGRDETDAIFIRILSRQPPSNPSQSYSREVLMGVLLVVMGLAGWITVPWIASLLDVAPSLVEGVVFGPTKALFSLNVDRVYFSPFSFEDFLLDANRAGEFFISGDKIDTLFTQILSCQPPFNPCQSYSPELLMDVLTVLMVWSGFLTVPQIASSLDIDPPAVKDIISGLPLVYSYSSGDVHLISGVESFLGDANRAGEFYIPPKRLNPNYDSMYAKISKIRGVN